MRRSFPDGEHFLCPGDPIVIYVCPVPVIIEMSGLPGIAAQVGKEEGGALSLGKSHAGINDPGAASSMNRVPEREHKNPWGDVAGAAEGR